MSADSRNYWYVLKNRLKKAESEDFANCKGLKLMAPDGKRRATDFLTNDRVIAFANNAMITTMQQTLPFCKSLLFLV